ncbi:MAG: hypothetical protein AB8B94_02155 [Hyphomicrobiales bacterium]
MKHVLAASLALCLTAFVPTLASADITRGCAFTIFSSNQAFSPTHRTLATIKTQGSCQNRSKANQCRSRAYNSGKSCVNDLWAARWTHTVPQSCKNLSGARTGARLQWNGIFPKLPNGNNSFKDRIEYEACCRADGLKSSGTVHVRWLGKGDKGCGPNRTGSKSFYGGGNFAVDYGVNCTALVKAGLCGTPTRTNN